MIIDIFQIGLDLRIAAGIGSIWAMFTMTCNEIDCVLNRILQTHDGINQFGFVRKLSVFVMVAFGHYQCAIDCDAILHSESGLSLRINNLVAYIAPALIAEAIEQLLARLEALGGGGVKRNHLHRLLEGGEHLERFGRE